MSRRPDDDARYEYLRESGPNFTTLEYEGDVWACLLRVDADTPDGFVGGTAQITAPGTTPYDHLQTFMECWAAPEGPTYDRELYVAAMTALAEKYPGDLFDEKGWVLDDRLAAWMFHRDNLDGNAGVEFIERAIDAARGVA